MTLATTSRPTARLRLLPAPAFDPPYDDELPTRSPVVDGTLALTFPASPNPIPLRLVPPADGSDSADLDSRPAVDRAALPDPLQWTRRLAQAIVEVLAGARSAAQLSGFASLDVLHHLERVAGRLGPRPGGPPVRRPRVTSAHVCEPVPGVVEACAVIDTGRRRRAIALRLEGVEARWRCTALQIG